MGINWEHERGYDETHGGFNVKWYTTPSEDAYDGDDALQVNAAILNGELMHFDVKCEVSAGNGVVLASDHLGSCVYRDFNAFYGMGDGYVSDMRENALQEARKYLGTITAETMAQGPSYIAIKYSENDFHSVRNVATGNDVALCENPLFAKFLSTGPITKPLTLDDVGAVLRLMGWEHEDVAGFFEAANTLGMLAHPFPTEEELARIQIDQREGYEE